MVDEYRLSRESTHEISRIHEPCKSSRISDSSVDLALECGILETKGNVEKPEKDCRICHLSLESHSKESGIPIVLGCSCKDDLAAAHKQCAETWFKIKGNKICEICGATANNVFGGIETQFTENWNDTNNTSAPNSAAQTETRRFWQGRRFLNFLLACLVFAFIASWLLRFNGQG
ncbi:hypothetical protein HPP92_017551 [Vanilla planifolia]|uniref:RING-CH-type domain-containing protein n=1 Tax=Vanilla planifolia TaxID=51239 RepID=A0A835Q8A1_VANPL|nr:hypothetical protein HPP92_018168 [Vanilla planifolia]KAG0468223.1 hypothetical protein HPP92_017551 [Vanilla planifolia]